MDKKKIDQRKGELSTSFSTNEAIDIQNDSDLKLQRSRPHITLDRNYGIESSSIDDSMRQPFTNDCIKSSSVEHQVSLATDNSVLLKNRDIIHTENLFDPNKSNDLEQIYIKKQKILNGDKSQEVFVDYYPQNQNTKSPYSESHLDNIDSEILFSNIPNSEDLDINLVDDIEEDCDTILPEIPDINEVQETKIPDNPSAHTYKLHSSETVKKRKTEFPEIPSEYTSRTQTIKKHNGKSKDKNKNSDHEQPPDNFFNKIEEEVNLIIQKVFKFSKDFSKQHNMKDHVTASINKISHTLVDMQEKIRTLSAATAQHSAYAMEKMKRKLSKMVQNIKDNSENLLKNSKDANLSSKIIRGFNHLKDGFIKRWSNLKEKISQKFHIEKQRADKIINFHSTSYSKYDYHSASPKSEKKHEKDSHSDTKKTKHDKKDSNRQMNQRYRGDKKLYNENGNKNKKYDKYFQKYNNKHNHNSKWENRQKNQYKHYKITKPSDETTQGNKKIQEQNNSRVGMRGEKCNNTDGRWLHHLATGRATQRRLEQESDWLFDRARSRATYRQNDHNEDWFLRRSKSRQQYRGNVIHQGHSVHINNV